MPADQPKRIVRDGLVIDAARHQLLIEGEPMELTATEFKLLLYLADNPGRVFSRAHLLSTVMAKGTDLIDRNIDVHIGSIRRKLGQQRKLIETVRGVGYRFRD